MAENFARVETKYLLTLEQALAMAEGLRARGFRRMDFGSPLVQSLYYDTPDHTLIRASLERPAYKEKLRLRAYGKPGALTQTFLEIKKKYNGVVYKRRAPLPLQAAMDGLRQGLLPAETGQVGREALWMTRRWVLRPAAVIAYERDAWASGDLPDVRVTMDRCLSFRDWDMDLNRQADSLSLLPADRRLMEIKTPGVCPLWLARLLHDCGAQRVHFSKYGLAYQQYILPGKKGIERSGSNCSTASWTRGA